MATIRDNWDLRAGFTKDYDLANSAVKEADRQFEQAQEIVKNAYALDKTSATQGAEIERMNQENLEKLLISQEKVGDFQSQQEIQRALESVGDPFIESPEDQQPVQPNRKIVTYDGKVMDDPTAPVDVVKNAERPPAQVAQRRPMTMIEKLKAVEPMIASPRAKYALRQRIQSAATEEARQLANIAPDEAFNGMIKNGVIRGNPMVANDDGTFTRVMPDGKNQIRLDRNEAAAWVGDVINKTNEQYKLLEKRRDVGERANAEIYVDRARSENRMGVDNNEARLRLITQSQKANLDDRNVRLRASVGAYSGGGGGGGGGGAAPGVIDFNAGSVNQQPLADQAPTVAPSGVAQKSLDEMSAKELNDEINELTEWRGKRLSDEGAAKKYDQAIQSARAALDKKERENTSQGKRLAGKINSLETLIADKNLPEKEQNLLFAEVTRLKNKYVKQAGRSDIRREVADLEGFQAQYDDLLERIRGNKKTGDKK